PPVVGAEPLGQARQPAASDRGVDPVAGFPQRRTGDGEVEGAQMVTVAALVPRVAGAVGAVSTPRRVEAPVAGAVPSAQVKVVALGPDVLGLVVVHQP